MSLPRAPLTKNVALSGIFMRMPPFNIIGSGATTGLLKAAINACSWIPPVTVPLVVPRTNRGLIAIIRGELKNNFYPSMVHMVQQVHVLALKSLDYIIHWS